MKDLFEIKIIDNEGSLTLVLTDYLSKKTATFSEDELNGADIVSMSKILIERAKRAFRNKTTSASAE